MNYFRYMHGSTLFFINTGITVCILFAFIALLVWLLKSGKLSEKLSTILIFIFVPTLLVGSHFAFGRLLDPYHHGVVREIFIHQSEDCQKLSVWLTRIYGQRFGGADYEQRLKTFDLETGQALELKELAPRHYSSEYTFYWPQDGTKRDGWPLRLGWFRPAGWYYHFADGSLGKHLLGPGQKPSPKSAILLKPRFIEEINKKAGQKNRIWITHRSAIHGDYYNLISLVDRGGREIKRINLNKLFDRGKVKAKPRSRNKEIVQPIGTYTRGDEVLIFITCGENFRSFDSGFTLTALRTDRKSGEILGGVDYIQ